MAHYDSKIWPAGDRGQSRADKEACRYKIYVPDQIAGRSFTFSGQVVTEITDAQEAIIKFNTEAESLANTEALARILLRAESVASSKIEGLTISPRHLLKAEAGVDNDSKHPNVTAQEVVANINAMDLAIQKTTSGGTITLDLILEINAMLLANTRFAHLGGKIRTTQNWIGGNDYNPCTAVFVPPVPESVNELLEDLISFCNQDDIPAVAQAAIAHAQFETIHPFVDGNGRTGRALIQIILRRRGLSPNVVPPVSLVLATQVKDYELGLDAIRYEAAENSSKAQEGINLWVARFAAACTRSVRDALEFEKTASEIEKKWRTTLESKKGTQIRKGSAEDRLLHGLIGIPVLTVATAMTITGRTHQATNTVIGLLVEAEILKPVTSAKRNRAYESLEMINAFIGLERQLASPGGNTRSSPPSRPAPSRPQRG